MNEEEEEENKRWEAKLLYGMICGIVLVSLEFSSLF